MEDKLFYDSHIIEYLDRNFVGLRAVDSDGIFYEKRELLPENINIGDSINEYRTRNTKQRFFEIDKKSNTPQIQKNFTEWAVYAITNSTVHLCNLSNFEEKVDVDEQELSLNSRPGDIFLFKDGKYYFDKLRNEVLCERYARLFDELNMTSIEVEHHIEDSHNFEQSFQIDEIVKKDEFETIFKLYRENDEPKFISSKNLPKNARVGDFVFLKENGEIDFDRYALLAYLKNLQTFNDDGGEI